MIKKLRIKFIIVAMVATAFVLFTVIGIVNIRNYVNIVDNADETLSLLVEGDGRFQLDNVLPPDTQGSGDKKRPDGFSPEMPFETRYFTVKLDSAGEIVSVDTDRIAAVNETTAAAYAKEIVASGKTQGFQGNYRDALSFSDGLTNVYFVDCTRD
ncbi:MAG: two-component sensor histidine kinase, partial [Candidatus Scatosoma sp.]